MSNTSAKATSNQKFWLFRLTRRRFEGKDITKSQASDIIGDAIEIRKQGKDNTPREQIDRLEMRMQTWFSEWTIDELNLDYIPNKKPNKPSTKEPEPAEDVPPPTPSAPSYPDTPAEHPVPVEDSDSPYENLPDATRDKIDEIERILKEKAAAKQPASTKTEDDPPEEVEEEDLPPVYIEIPDDVEFPPEFVMPAQFNHWYSLAKNGINFMLVGPAGCGKTYVAQMIAKALKLDAYTCSLSGGVRYNQVFGSTRIQNGETVWEPSDMLKAVQVPGVVIFDEALAPDADILIGLNSLTEQNQRFINTPGGVVHVHPECRFIATANNKGRQQSRGYIGAQIQDGSILDRFGIKFDVDYDETVEVGIANQYLNKKTSKAIVSAINKLREKLRQNEINFDPSTRRMILMCRQIKEAGIDKDVAFETTFLTSLSRAERQTIGY